MSEETTTTYPEKIQQMLDTVGEMTVRELVDLKEAFKETFKVEAAAPVMGGMMMAAPGEAAEEEKTSFDVVLKGPGASKIQVIKAVRAITSLGLKEAKELVDNAPKEVKEGVSKAEAEEIVTKITGAGGTAEIK